MITFAWIKGYLNRWKTFVANRIVQTISLGEWRHILSEENSVVLQDACL